MEMKTIKRKSPLSGWIDPRRAKEDLPVNGAAVNGVEFVFGGGGDSAHPNDADAIPAHDSDLLEVEALLEAQERYARRYIPIKKYVFDGVSARNGGCGLNFPGVAPLPTPVSGTVSPCPYRVESIADPAPAKDSVGSVMALARGVIDGPRTAGDEGNGSPLVSRGAGSDERRDPNAYQPGDEQLSAREVVIDANGQPRQAGALMPEGEYIKRYKRRAEESLFIFAKGVLARHFLTRHFHRDICNWLQVCPPFRKLLIMPREHVKTGIVSGALPQHIIIQPAETNIYFPGLEGSECRILLSGETAYMAEKNLRVIQSTFEENRIFRAFWPHRVWHGNPKSLSGMWNNQGMIVPRENEWPDPTIRAVGVGGAVTGSRPNVMIKDDLTTFAAANSDVIMDEAIEWHKASRALLDKYEIESGLQSLEFMAATRWAVYDLVSYVIDHDPSVEVCDERFHRIIRDGRILWPEKYTEADVEQLRREHGSNFFLLYLNTPADPSLVDFDTALIRNFEIIGDSVAFTGDERDALLETAIKAKKARVAVERPPANVPRGQRLTVDVIKRMLAGGGGVRLRAA